MNRPEITRAIGNQFSEEFYNAMTEHFEFVTGETPSSIFDIDIAYCMAAV